MEEEEKKYAAAGTVRMKGKGRNRIKNQVFWGRMGFASSNPSSVDDGLTPLLGAGAEPFSGRSSCLPPTA